MRVTVVASLFVSLVTAGCTQCAETTIDVTQAKGDSMTSNAALTLALSRAASGPDASSSLVLTYVRGHDLYGTTTLRVEGTGRFSLTSNETAGRKQVSFEGVLAPPQYSAVMKAAVDDDVLATRPSSRPLGDDEVPVIVTVESGGEIGRVMVWDEDARHLPAFHGFEVSILEVVRSLSSGAILTHVN